MENLLDLRLSLIDITLALVFRTWAGSSAFVVVHGFLPHGPPEIPCFRLAPHFVLS